MPNNKGEIEVTGRVNGMGEMDPNGSYAEFIIRDDEVWTLSISEQQAIDIAVNIGRAWPEAVREAHAAGKAEGAAGFIERVARLNPEHCGADPEDDAQALRGLILTAREIASKRSEAPDDR